MVTFHRRYKENVGLQKTCKYIADIVIVICLAIVLTNYTCSKTKIYGNSMNSTLENGDTVLINHLRFAVTSPSRYDIIAFESSGVSSSKTYIKRVIGLPGETVQIKDGKVYINGSPLTNDISDENIITAGLAADAVTLGDDEYFVLGDNRNNSEDSRFFNIGTVKKEDIIGTPWLVVAPVKNFKLIF